MNLLPAVWQGDEVVLDGVAHTVGAHASAPREVTLGVRPGDLRVAAVGNAARVDYIEELGDHRVLDLKLGEQRVKLTTDAQNTLGEGDALQVGFEPAAAHLFDRASGARLN